MRERFLRTLLSLAVVLTLTGVADAKPQWGSNCISCHSDSRGAVDMTDRRHLQSLAQEPTNRPVWPTPEVIAAWEKAGARYHIGSGGVPFFLFRRTPTERFSVLPALEVPFGLVLNGKSVTDAGLIGLAELKQLQTLDLNFTKVTDAGLRELAGLTQLQTLGLLMSQVTDTGLKELSGMTQLRTLNLHGTQVSDVGLKALAGLTQLQTLKLGGTQVTDAGLKELAGMTNLRMLILADTHVTGAGLMELAGLTQLQTLDLYSTLVTDAGVQKLRQALPRAHITR